MSDITTTASPDPKPAGSKTWADVGSDALHYIAAAAIVAVVGFFFWNGKVSQDLFVLTLTGSAAVVGIKLR